MYAVVHSPFLVPSLSGGVAVITSKLTTLNLSMWHCGTVPKLINQMSSKGETKKNKSVQLKGGVWKC